MKFWSCVLVMLASALLSTGGLAAEPLLKFGVGLFQPNRDKNDATYRPLADYLAARLNRPVVLRTVDSWEGLAKSLANGETDIALMGPWGYVLANNEAGSQVVASILYDNKPEYHAIIVTHPDSGIQTVADLKGRTFAFGDKGSTSGYLIPLHFFMTQGIDDFLSKPENSWMNNVSKNAQVRFLKIITSVPLSKISDAKTMAGIVKRLLSDKEIGPALKKQYGNNITADLIASSQGSLQSSMSSAQHKLSKY